MQYKEMKLPIEGSMDGAILQLYLLKESEEIVRKQKRKMIVLCPGGGYEMTSDREAEAIAMMFLSRGHHVAVLRYSISPVHYPVALMEVAWTMKYIKEHAEDWQVDANKIVVQGSSAGGHLATSFACFYQEQFLLDALHTTEEMLRPGGLMLSYPVITSGEFAHHGSFHALLGNEYEAMKEKMSLEKQVHMNMPPTFIWHTFTDNVVPVENSLFLVGALKEQQISTEFHLFPEGVHGLGLASELTLDRNEVCIQKECQIWITLALDWLDRL